MSKLRFISEKDRYAQLSATLARVIAIAHRYALPVANAVRNLCRAARCGEAGTQAGKAQGQPGRPVPAVSRVLQATNAGGSLHRL